MSPKEGGDSRPHRSRAKDCSQYAKGESHLTQLVPGRQRSAFQVAHTEHITCVSHPWGLLHTCAAIHSDMRLSEHVDPLGEEDLSTWTFAVHMGAWASVPVLLLLLENSFTFFKARSEPDVVAYTCDPPGLQAEGYRKFDSSLGCKESSKPA